MREKYIKYLDDFCRDYGYPDEARKTLLAALDAVFDSREARETVLSAIERYRSCSPDGFDYDSMLSAVDLLEEGLGVNKFTLQLVNYILLSEPLKEKYLARGIDGEVFFDSMSDLKWKLFECKRLHGVYGTHVARWHVGFFKMTHFALGRLQFHVINFTKEATVCGIRLDSNSKVINIHIPSCGPLTDELCIDAYSRAEKFFAGTFPEGEPTVFMCDSWLLFPEHKVILPETSGIRRFAEQFSLVHARYASPGFRPWPIFYDKQKAAADELPRNTSLERIYAERYEKGLPSGSGVGVIVFKDGKILNTEKDKMV